MTGQPTLDDLLERHRGVRRLLPNAWNAFFARFGSLRAIQLESVPPILARKNVLMTAPTAGGKTEAAVAPLAELIKSQRWPGLSVLLITPTRALVNDLFCRLERPCDQMQVQLGRKTSDHSMSEGGSEQLLITTPESTESLLTFRRQTLANVRSVVLDEVHLLDGSPRGDQLRVLLARLSTFLHDKAGPANPGKVKTGRPTKGGGFDGLQVVAMSATVPDPRRIADAYLGRQSIVVSVPGQRDLDAQIISADGSDEARSDAAVQAFEVFGDVRKVLVFVNSRKQVDEGARYFRRGPFARAAVFGHHGSLSKEQREQTEARFKSEGRAICVATMTLEVGIDIGDVDLVVCMDPPFSLSSFLQRIGRGCRRLAGKTRVLCVARDREGVILFESMVRQAGLGLPVGPLRPFRTSVLVQQILAYLRQVDRHCRVFEQFLRVLASNVPPVVTEERIRQVLADLVQQGLVDRRGQVYQPAAAGWDFIQSSRIYSNMEPAPVEQALVDADSGRIVATVAAVRGKHVRVAGRSYEVVAGGRRGEHKVRGVQGEAVPPRYHSQHLPYSADLGAAVAGRLGIDPDTLVVVPSGGGVIVMTWLGQLLNAALAEALEADGVVVADKPFSLILQGRSMEDALPLVTKAVTVVVQTNPLGRMKVEGIADLGPYLRELSPTLQEVARRDWLDAGYLSNWVAGLRRVQPVEADTDLGRDLLDLC